MILSSLIAAMVLQDQRIERRIEADPVPVSAATRGLVADPPKLEYDLRELLMCDPDERQPRLCYSLANLDEWRSEEAERKEDRLMEEAMDQARQAEQEDNVVPWR